MINVPLYGDAKKAIQDGIAKQQKATSMGAILGPLKGKNKKTNIATGLNFTPSIFGTQVPVSNERPRPTSNKYGSIIDSYSSSMLSGLGSNLPQADEPPDFDLSGLLDQIAGPDPGAGVQVPGWWQGAKKAGDLRKDAKAFGPRSIAQARALGDPNSLEYWMANWDQENPDANSGTRREFRDRLDAIRQQMLWATGPKNRSQIDPQFAAPRGPRTLSYPTDVSLGEDAYGPVGPGRIDPELMNEVIKSLWRFDPRTGQTGDFLTDWSIQNQNLVTQIQNQEKKSRPPTAIEGVADNFMRRYRDANESQTFGGGPEDQMRQLMAILAPLEAVAGGTIAPLEEGVGTMLGRPIARGQQEFRDPGMGAAEGVIDPNQFTRQGDWVDWTYKNLLNLLPVTRIANIGAMAGQGLEGLGAYTQELRGKGDKRSKETLEAFKAPFEADPIGELSSLMTGLYGHKVASKFKNRGKGKAPAYDPGDPTLNRTQPVGVQDMDPTLTSDPTRQFSSERTGSYGEKTQQSLGKTRQIVPNTDGGKLRPGMTKDGWTVEEILPNGDVRMRNPAGNVLDLNANWVAQSFGVDSPYAEKTNMGSREKTQSFDAEKELGVKPKETPKTTEFNPIFKDVEETPTVETPKPKTPKPKKTPTPVVKNTPQVLETPKPEGPPERWDDATRNSMKHDIQLMREQGIDEDAQRAFIAEKYGWTQPKGRAPKPKPTPIVKRAATQKPTTPKPQKETKTFDVSKPTKQEFVMGESKPETPQSPKPEPKMFAEPTSDPKNLSTEDLRGMGFSDKKIAEYKREPANMRGRWLRINGDGKKAGAADVRVLGLLTAAGVGGVAAYTIANRLSKDPEAEEKLKTLGVILTPLAGVMGGDGKKGKKAEGHAVHFEESFAPAREMDGPTAQEEAEYYSMIYNQLAKDSPSSGKKGTPDDVSMFAPVPVGESRSSRQGVTSVMPVQSNTKSGRSLSRFFTMRLPNPSGKMVDVPMIIIPTKGKNNRGQDVMSLTHNASFGDGSKSEAANIIAFRGVNENTDWRFTENDYNTLLEKPKDASWTDYPELLDGVFRGFTRPIEYPFNPGDLSALERTVSQPKRTVKKGATESPSELPTPRKEPLTPEKAMLENAFIQYALISTGEIVNHLDIPDKSGKAKEIVAEAFKAYLRNVTRSRKNMTDESIYMEKQSTNTLGRHEALSNVWSRITGQDAIKLSEGEMDPKNIRHPESIEAIKESRDIAAMQGKAILDDKGEFVAIDPDAHKTYIDLVREAADALPEDLRGDFDEFFYERQKNKDKEGRKPRYSISRNQADLVLDKILDTLDSAGDPERANRITKEIYKRREIKRRWAQKTLKRLGNEKMTTTVMRPVERNGKVVLEPQKIEMAAIQHDWIQHDYNITALKDLLYGTSDRSYDDYYWAAEIVDRLERDIHAMKVISKLGIGDKAREAAKAYTHPVTGEVIDVTKHYDKAASRWDRKAGAWKDAKEMRELKNDSRLKALMFETDFAYEEKLEAPGKQTKEPAYLKQTRDLLDSIKARNKGVLPEKIAGYDRETVIEKIKNPDWKVKRSALPLLEMQDSYMKLRMAVEDKNGGKLPDRIAGVPAKYLDQFMNSPKDSQKAFALALLDAEARGAKVPKDVLEKHFAKNKEGKFHGIQSSAFATGAGILALAEAGGIVQSLGQAWDELDDEVKAGIGGVTKALAGAAILWMAHKGGRAGWNAMGKFGKGVKFQNALSKAWLSAELRMAKFRQAPIIREGFVSVDRALQDVALTATKSGNFARNMLGATESIIVEANRRYNKAVHPLHEAYVNLSPNARKLLDPMPNGEFVGSRHRYVSAVHKGDPIPPDLKEFHEAWVKEQKRLEQYAWDSRTMSTVRELVEELDRKKMIGKEVQWFDNASGKVVQGTVKDFISPGEYSGVHALVAGEDGRQILIAPSVEIARRSYLGENFMPLKIRADVHEVFDNKDFNSKTFKNLKAWATAKGFLPNNPSDQQVLKYWNDASGLTAKVAAQDNMKMRSPLRSRINQMREANADRLPAWIFETDAVHLMNDHLRRGYMLVEEAKKFGAKEGRALAEVAKKYGMTGEEIEDLYNLMSIKMNAHRNKWSRRDWHKKNTTDKWSSYIYLAKLMNDSIGILQASQSATGYGLMGFRNMAAGAMGWLGKQAEFRTDKELIKAMKTGRIGAISQAIKKAVHGYDYLDIPVMNGAMDMNYLTDVIGGEMGSAQGKGLTPHKMTAFQAKWTGTAAMDVGQRVYMAHGSHAMVLKSLDNLRKTLDKANPNWRTLKNAEILKLVNNSRYEDRWVREFVRPMDHEYVEALKGTPGKAFVSKSYKAGVRANVLLEQGVLPEYASTPVGRLAYQFQSFMFGQSQLAKFAFKEAVFHGNSTPLARMALGAMGIYAGQAVAYQTLQEVLDIARQFVGQRKPFTQTISDGENEFTEPESYQEKEFEKYLTKEQKGVYDKLMDAWLGTAMMGIAGTPIDQWRRNQERKWSGGSQNYDRIIPPVGKTAVDIGSAAFDLAVPNKKTLIEKARHHTGELFPQAKREFDRAGYKRVYN